MNNKRIEKGDIVKVYFNNVPALHGVTVKYVPECSGDYWVFTNSNSEGGKLVYVQQYARIDLVMKYDPDKTSTPIK